MIGHEIAPGEKALDDAVGENRRAGDAQRWPVTISYFDRSSAGDRRRTDAGLFDRISNSYENGISRALSLDYGDFVISGDDDQLDFKEAKPCK